MPTSDPGNNASLLPRRREPRVFRAAGFTLIELLIVVAIVAMAAASVSFALRDSAATLLERDAQRLAAVLEAARAESRTSGLPVRWRPVAGGFQLEGIPLQDKPQPWLAESTVTVGTPTLVLGPEPIIGPQAVVLGSTLQPERSIRVTTDGLRPFTVEAGPSS